MSANRPKMHETRNLSDNIKVKKIFCHFSDLLQILCLG
jgi:hypothetical protein